MTGEFPELLILPETAPVAPAQSRCHARRIPRLLYLAPRDEYRSVPERTPAVRGMGDRTAGVRL